MAANAGETKVKLWEGICYPENMRDDYGMDYAVLNYGINEVGIQDLKESGFKPVYSDNLTVCLKRSTV